MLLNRRCFCMYGKQSYVLNPLKIEGMPYISIHDHVTIHEGTWLAAKPMAGESVELKIGEGTVLGHFNHIFATQSIVIGKYVLTADKVYISDNLHRYENIDVPVINQGIKQCSNVEIGEGSWLGENVCVIGANSVVTHDIPDFCVAVGAPAKVIKQYDFHLERWVKYNP